MTDQGTDAGTRTWSVRSVNITRSIIRGPDAGVTTFVDAVYNVTVDTPEGPLHWAFSTCVTNDPDQFRGSKFQDDAQNGPEAYTQLDSSRDSIVVMCDQTLYTTQLPTGVVASIIEDLHALGDLIHR